jgi:hypothetical protein
MKKEKKPAVRAKKVKFDFNKAEDAIVGGRFIVQVGEKVVVLRERNEKKQVSLCIFKGIEANGDVTMWDETISQFFSFNTGDAPLVKIPGDQISMF